MARPGGSRIVRRIAAIARVEAVPRAETLALMPDHLDALRAHQDGEEQPVRAVRPGATDVVPALHVGPGNDPDHGERPPARDLPLPLRRMLEDTDSAPVAARAALAHWGQ